MTSEANVGKATDNLKPKSSKAKRFWEKATGRRNKTVEDKTDSVKEEGLVYADHLALASEALDDIIEAKEKDYRNETDRKVENALKLEVLKTQRFHLNQIVELSLQYGDMKQ